MTLVHLSATHRSLLDLFLTLISLFSFAVENAVKTLHHQCHKQLSIVCIQYIFSSTFFEQLLSLRSLNVFTWHDWFHRKLCNASIYIALWWCNGLEPEALNIYIYIRNIYHSFLMDVQLPGYECLRALEPKSAGVLYTDTMLCQTEN